MCYAVFIGTNIIQTTGTFIANQTDLYLEEPSQDELIGLRPKFTKTYLYYVGSYQGCSCGFSCDPTNLNDQETGNDKVEQIKAVRSVTALLSLIDKLTKQEDLEFYCCWEGDWKSPIEYRDQIDIRQIRLGTNYFGLTEKEFTLFNQQPSS